MAAQLFIDSSGENSPHAYLEFFKDSIGKGPGKYYSGIGEVYRSSSRYQKGYGLLGVSQNDYGRRGDGLGNMLSNLWRIAFPMIKKGAQKLGSAALDVATNVATDALSGKNIKEAATEHLKKKGSELLKDINPSLIGTIDKPKDNIGTLTSSTKPVLAATPPTSFRKIPRKRAPTKVKFRVPKKAKYPALKYL
jgi:hypothetical protein